MTKVDSVGKRAIVQRTAVIVLLVEVQRSINEIACGIKGRNKPTQSGCVPLTKQSASIWSYLNGKLAIGLLDSGSCILLINFDTCERVGKPGSIKAFSFKMLVANNSSLKIVDNLDIQIQMSGEFTLEFLVTANSCLTRLFGLDVMLDQESILNIGENCYTVRNIGQH